MFLHNYFNNNKNAKSLSKTSGTFEAGYDYWSEALFERTMRIFVWKKTISVPPKEIESPLIIDGTCGVSNKYKGNIAAFHGAFGGAPTVYYDDFKKYNVNSPVYSASLDVDKDVVVIDNNSARNSLYPLIHRYASMLSHVEVSLVNTLINGRDSGGIPIASTEAQKQSIENYRNALCNGKVSAILDPAFSGVQFLGINKNTTLQVKDLIEVRENLLNSFYHDIGVKTAWNKKGNMIVQEVQADNGMLLLNLSDMLNSRKIGADKVNKMFGTEWEVDIAEEIRYTLNEKGDVENVEQN